MKIQPEKQFPHSVGVVAELGRQYDMVVADYREAASGIENTTLIVGGTDRTYVFRIYRQDKKTNEQVQAKLDFMAYLHQSGVPTPQIIPNNQKQLITLFPVAGSTWQVIAMEFVAGEHVDKPSAKLLTDMATTQARMHILAAKYPKPTNNIRVIRMLSEQDYLQVERRLSSPLEG